MLLRADVRHARLLYVIERGQEGSAGSAKRTLDLTDDEFERRHPGFAAWFEARGHSLAG